MLIDTHCHLHDLEWFTPDQQTEFLNKAHQNGVEKLICIGTNPVDSKNAQAFAEQHANVYWTYGIHPEYASSYEQSADLGNKQCSCLRTPGGSAEDERDGPATAGVIDATSDKNVGWSPKSASMPVAIGEIGLDYHYEGYDRTAQLRLFEQMLQLALDCDLPVSLHIREAFADAWGVIDNFPGTHGVVHSFTGSKRDLKQALARNFYIGVNGLVTYTTPALPPLERIVLETDAPFLTPVPFRGTINQPGYVRFVAQYLAEKLGVAEKEIEERTTQNAGQIFQI